MFTVLLMPENENSDLKVKREDVNFVSQQYK